MVLTNQEIGRLYVEAYKVWPSYGTKQKIESISRALALHTTSIFDHYQQHHNLEGLTIEGLPRKKEYAAIVREVVEIICRKGGEAAKELVLEIETQRIYRQMDASRIERKKRSQQLRTRKY